MFPVQILEIRKDEWELRPTVRYNPDEAGCTNYIVWFEAGNERGAAIRRGWELESACKSATLDRVNSSSLELDRWYSVRIEAVGPRIMVYLDGKAILSVRSMPFVSSSSSIKLKLAGNLVASVLDSPGSLDSDLGGED